MVFPSPGRSFTHELISAVAPMRRDKLDDALEQLVAAELIFRRDIPPDAEYTFKHALVRDAAYDTLLRSNRQRFIHACRQVAPLGTRAEARVPKFGATWTCVSA
jgi:predicted ATPase